MSDVVHKQQANSASRAASAAKVRAPELSVVVPFYNEEEGLSDMLSTLLGVLEKARISWEIICVNDGSCDGSAELLNDWQRRDPRINIVHLSRRFGKEAALLAGMELSRGRAVVILDGDLQHPPALIPEMVDQWRAGYDVINARKRPSSGTSLPYRLGSALFYRFLNPSFSTSIARASDFKLLDREVVDAVLSCRERTRFFRGLVAWVGFTPSDIEFDVPARGRGGSKWTPRQLVSYAVDTLISFTSLPLRLIAWAGFFTVLAGMALAVQTLYNYFAGIAVTGFTTVILLQILLCGFILLSLGIMSLYQAHMYDELKQRPLYIVRKQRRTRQAPSDRASDSSDAATKRNASAPPP